MNAEAKEAILRIFCGNHINPETLEPMVKTIAVEGYAPLLLFIEEKSLASGLAVRVVSLFRSKPI